MVETDYKICQFCGCAMAGESDEADICLLCEERRLAEPMPEHQPQPKEET